MRIKIIITSILSLTLGGCGSYKSSFSCGDSMGANCTSMDRVYLMIKSGEIERYNEKRQTRQYKVSKDSKELLPRVKSQAVNVTNYQVDDASN